MNEKLFIPVLLGTSRPGRRSEAVAKFVVEETKTYGLETELLDIKDFPIGNTIDLTETTKRWRELMTKADGLIILAPEYNHGYSGELKMLLDLAYQEYNHKPLGVCGVSSGPLGGARMVEQLRLVAIELQMTPIRNAVYFSLVQDIVGEDGLVKDPDNWRKKLGTVLDEMKWYGEVLKEGRNKNK
jgi:NAD(P)H-dependent FMN reductase